MRLVACSECHRHFDAANVADGTLIRCPCGQTFKALPPASVDIPAVRCSSCGMPIAPGGASCRSCAAPIGVLDRDLTVICPVCGARLPTAARFCSGCGGEVSSKAWCALPAAAECPRCHSGLRHRELAAVSVIECASCLGIWLSPVVFENWSRDVKRDAFDLGHIAVATAEPASATPFRYLKCIICADLMVPRTYPSGSRVIIDVCGRHGIWFDHQELQHVLAWLRNCPDSPALSTPAAPPASSVPSALQPEPEGRSFATSALLSVLEYVVNSIIK